MNKNRPTGMFGFTIVWLGQIVSVLASAMSQFGLTIWMYDQTKSAFAMGMMQVFFITPFLLISPIAGVMVDRHNRKLMMMVSDMAAGVATLAILAFQYFGILNSGICTPLPLFMAWAWLFNGLHIPPPSARWFQKSNTAAPMA